MLRRWVLTAVLPLLLMGLVGGVLGCASTAVGKGVQAADLQKRVAERAMTEVAKMHLRKELTDVNYGKARDAYVKWYEAEKGVAQALSEWKAIQSAPNEDRLNTALRAVTPLTEALFNAIKVIAPGLLERVQKEVSYEWEREPLLRQARFERPALTIATIEFRAQFALAGR